MEKNDVGKHRIGQLGKISISRGVYRAFAESMV